MRISYYFSGFLIFLSLTQKDVYAIDPITTFGNYSPVITGVGGSVTFGGSVENLNITIQTNNKTIIRKNLHLKKKAKTSFLNNLFFTVGGSFKSYEYKIDSTIGKKKYFSDQLPAIKYTLGYQLPNGSSLVISGENILNSNDVTTVNPYFSQNTLAKLKRDEYTLTATYPLSSKTSLLGGYRSGKTFINYKTIDLNEKDKIKTYGPFIGIQRNLYRNNNNDVSLSLFYNYLSTDFLMNTKDGDFKFNFKGAGAGLNLGWRYRLANKKYMLLSTEIFNYDHNKMKNSNVPVEKFSLEETVYSVRAEYIHVF